MAFSGFLWGKEEFTSLELIETFKDTFPIVVRVKDGYCGDSPWECLSQSEVLRIHGVEKQKRAIAIDPHGRYYSIPASYSARALQAGKKTTKGSYERLSEILQSSVVPFEVELNTEGIHSKERNDQFKHFNLQRITIIDTYEERLMKANLIQTNAINHEVILIPAYVRATFEVSHPTELDSNIHRTAAKLIDFNKANRNHAILIYSTHMLEKKIESRQKHGDENLYESLLPTEMISSPASNQTYQTLSEHHDGPVLVGQKSGKNADTYQSIDNEMKVSRLHPSKQQSRGVAVGDEKKPRDHHHNLHAEHMKPVLPVKPNKTDPKADYGMQTSRRGPPQVEDPTQPDTRFPKDVSDATMGELCRCLKLLKMERHCAMFKMHLIDGPLLMRLNEHVLVVDLGMSALDAKKLVMFCRGWRPS